MSQSHPRSFCGDAVKLRTLRQSLGWTQDVAAAKSGYTTRLIRKFETGGNVRPETFINILQCYHEAAGLSDWQWSDFLASDDDGRSLVSSDASSDEAVEGQRVRMERVKEYFDVIFNRRLVHRIDEFIHDEILLHAEGTSRRGIDVIRQRAMTLLEGFDPIRVSIERIFAHEQTVIAYWGVTMKQVGEFGEIPATQRWVSARGNSMVQFAEGRVIEVEEQWDVDDVIRQLNGDDPRTI